jgi:ABC-type multidrug transport system ATPase subunit
MSLIIKNLTKKFDNKTVIDNLSYEFPEKGIVAITGESGIGKTTLLRIISGLDWDYSGLVRGGNIGHVSFAFQEYRLFPHLTALENVIFANSETKSEAVVQKSKDMLKSLGLKESDFNLYPHELSGGMKQRISLARAFLKDVPTLLLDEPTKELDKENILLLIDVIRSIADQRLVIIVTHNLEDIECLSPTILKISK